MQARFQTRGWECSEAMWRAFSGLAMLASALALDARRLIRSGAYICGSICGGRFWIEISGWLLAAASAPASTFAAADSLSPPSSSPAAAVSWCKRTRSLTV